MYKKFLIISTFFILISCSDGFTKLEDRVKTQAKNIGVEMSFFEVKKEALYIFSNGVRMTHSLMK